MGIFDLIFGDLTGTTKSIKNSREKKYDFAKEDYPSEFITCEFVVDNRISSEWKLTRTFKITEKHKKDYFRIKDSWGASVEFTEGLMFIYGRNVDECIQRANNISKIVKDILQENSLEFYESSTYLNLDWYHKIQEICASKNILFEAFNPTSGFTSEFNICGKLREIVNPNGKQLYSIIINDDFTIEEISLETKEPFYSPYSVHEYYRALHRYKYEFCVYAKNEYDAEEMANYIINYAENRNSFELTFKDLGFMFFRCD